ncbi:MAG: response regulator [Thermodesulfobacteriota bacterium]
MGRRLLVVEDSRVVSGLVTDALVRHGYECLQAFDGLEALRRFEAEPLDALVLDLNIPQIHGLEVLRHVKRRRPGTVVVVLTGHGSEQTALQALTLGADDYLTKPFREESLVASLENHLRRADLEQRVDDACAQAGQEEEARLAPLFLGAPVALVHADGEGVVRALNREASRVLGRPPAALVGSPLEELAGEEVRRHWLGVLRREATTARRYEGEVHLTGPGGPFPASVLAAEGPEEGHLILALRDLTRQKAFEKRYFESKKLASLGRVVEGVAHEVRNPLISIGGFARKLREGAGDGTRQGRYLDVIVSEVERLEQMVRDIEAFVHFSRRTGGQFSPVDLIRVLGTCVEGCTPQAAGAGVRVRWEPPAEGIPVYGDAALLGELFSGLLENALEAMPGGGELGVELRPVDAWVQVRVEDTGVGIPEEDLDAIFDPFFTSKTSGAGLGLAKAHLIVEEHSGTIDFESSVGKGTTCTVSLPVDRRRVPRGSR